MQILKFKRRADLLEFSQKFPGALAAQFVVAAVERLENASATNERQLYRADLARWARDYAQLKEVRDQREVQTLCAAMQRITRDEVPQALDLMSQRIKSILLAKSSKGSWEKAQNIELLAIPEASVALGSEISLAGLPS